MAKFDVRGIFFFTCTFLPVRSICVQSRSLTNHGNSSTNSRGEEFGIVMDISNCDAVELNIFLTEKLQGVPI